MSSENSRITLSTKQIKDHFLQRLAISRSRERITKKKQPENVVYLLDKYIGLDAHDKVSTAALTRALREAVETSYRKGGEEACLTCRCCIKADCKETYTQDGYGNGTAGPGRKEKDKKSAHPGR